MHLHLLAQPALSAIYSGPGDSLYPHKAQSLIGPRLPGCRSRHCHPPRCHPPRLRFVPDPFAPALRPGKQRRKPVRLLNQSASRAWRGNPRPAVILTRSSSDTGPKRLRGGAAKTSLPPSCLTLTRPASHSWMSTPSWRGTPPASSQACAEPRVGWPANGNSSR